TGAIASTVWLWLLEELFESSLRTSSHTTNATATATATTAPIRMPGLRAQAAWERSFTGMRIRSFPEAAFLDSRQAGPPGLPQPCRRLRYPKIGRAHVCTPLTLVI